MNVQKTERRTWNPSGSPRVWATKFTKLPPSPLGHTKSGLTVNVSGSPRLTQTRGSS